jgi:hypothetical protein
VFVFQNMLNTTHHDTFDGFCNRPLATSAPFLNSQQRLLQKKYSGKAVHVAFMLRWTSSTSVGSCESLANRLAGADVLPSATSAA